jgi:hypothetical protein
MKMSIPMDIAVKRLERWRVESVVVAGSGNDNEDNIDMLLLWRRLMASLSSSLLVVTR